VSAKIRMGQPAYATKNFNDLPNEAKAALQKAGMVSQGGRIK
jgi:hypothetical protein